MSSSVIETESKDAAFDELLSDFVARPLDGTWLAAEPAAVEEHPDVDRYTLGWALTEWLFVLVGAVVIALVLRVFVFQAFWIPSESMEHTLQAEDRVLVNKLSYRLHDVNRGDIIVFRRPDEQAGEIRDLIKRVGAIEGDVVEGRDNQLVVNGEPVFESYLDDNESIGYFGPIKVPASEVFVMGDNRDESYDSRLFGTVHKDRIIGRAVVLFWPMGRAAIV
ncbi:MAG: signal peptidase I [Actinomycetota bacterium]|nr:signal peptidase I [Actinomycetota bacterium]